jgi:hypothetical protein
MFQWRWGSGYEIPGGHIENVTLHKLGEKSYALSDKGARSRLGDKVGYSEYNVVCEVTEKGLLKHGNYWASIEPFKGGTHVSLPENPFMLDLKDNCFRALKPYMDFNLGRKMYRAKGLKDVAIRPWQGGGFRNCFPLRDTNGHIWHCGEQWDGKTWQVIKHGYELGLPKRRSVLDPARAKLNDAGTTWEDLFPDEPGPLPGRSSALLWAYDPSTRRAWMRVGNELRHIEFRPKGQKIIRRVRDPNIKLPSLRVRTPDGHWWGTAAVGKVSRRRPVYASRVIRLAGDELRAYPMSRPHFLFLDSNKNVWVRSRSRKFFKYDPQEDKFVAAEPYEDSSFRMGRYTLSAVPEMAEWCRLYEKRNGKWDLFMTDYYKRHHFWLDGRAGAMLRGDRMLVRAGGLGLMEYNGKEDRWVRLGPGNELPRFDDRGRRITAGRNFVLVFDGDPFDYLPRPAEARKERKATAARLVRQMGDKNLLVRGKAGEELKKLAPKLRAELREALKDQDLPPDIRAHIKAILEETKNSPVPPPPDLFGQMHPVKPYDPNEKRPQAGNEKTGSTTR